MKVNIGPYKSWFGPYQLAEKILFWIPKQKDEYGFYENAEIVHKFGDWLADKDSKPDYEIGDEYKLFDNYEPSLIARFLSWIDTFKNRKVKVRIDPWDTWSMYSTLGYIIRPMLKQLKEKSMATVDDSDVPEHLRSTAALPKENEWDTDANHFARWDWVLDEMIFAFESIDGGENEDWENQFTVGKIDYRLKKIDDKYSQIFHGENHTAKTDLDGMKTYQKRISNGFMLFGKYYQSLWD